jgi:hypothetical protein
VSVSAEVVSALELLVPRRSLPGFEFFSAISAYLCDLCVNYSREKYLNAEIRRDRREESDTCMKHFRAKPVNVWRNQRRYSPPQSIAPEKAK